MSNRVYLIAAGDNEQYHIVAAAPTWAEAQEYVDAYNALSENEHDEAFIEETYLYRSGGQLPRQVHVYGYASTGPWMGIKVVEGPHDEPQPRVLTHVARPRAVFYPTPEAAKAAYEEALREH